VTIKQLLEAHPSEPDDSSYQIDGINIYQVSDLIGK